MPCSNNLQMHNINKVANLLYVIVLLDGFYYQNICMEVFEYFLIHDLCSELYFDVYDKCMDLFSFVCLLQQNILENTCDALLVENWQIVCIDMGKFLDCTRNYCLRLMTIRI